MEQTENSTVSESNQKKEAERLARLYKYYYQFRCDMKFTLSYERVPISSFFKANKKLFNKLNMIVKKYRIDSDKYIRFCINELKIRTPKELLLIDSIIRYADYLKINEQYRKIYDIYMKSVDYVADKCIENNMTPLEYMSMLIKTNQLAYEYICGNISNYYIASIQNFKKIFYHLDHTNKEELRIIYDVADKLNQDVQDSFMKFKSHRIKPLSITEQIIKQKQEKQTIN